MSTARGAGLAHPLTLLLCADHPSAPDTRTTRWSRSWCRPHGMI